MDLASARLVAVWAVVGPVAVEAPPLSEAQVDATLARLEALWPDVSNLPPNGLSSPPGLSPTDGDLPLALSVRACLAVTGAPAARRRRGMSGQHSHACCVTRSGCIFVLRSCRWGAKFPNS